MKITMGCGPTGNAVRLQLDVTGPTPEAALREVVDQMQRFAIDKGISDVFSYTHEQMFRRISEARVESDKLRAELAESRARRDEDRARGARALDAALRERDAARAEVERLSKGIDTLIISRDGWRDRAKDAEARIGGGGDGGAYAYSVAAGGSGGGGGGASYQTGDVLMSRAEWQQMKSKFADLARERDEALKTAAALHVQRDELQAEVSKMTTRRDRWRKRMETAAELAVAMRDQRDEAIAQARAARDLAAVRNGIAEELVKTRADLAQARSKALTEAADAIAADAHKWAAPSHRAVMLDTAGKLRACANAEAQTWRGPIEVPKPTPGAEPEPGTAEFFDRHFEALGYKPMETDSVEILRAILRTAEGIRADLQRARDARRA